MLFALGIAGTGSRIFSAHFTVAGAFRDGWALVAPGQFRSLTAGSLGAGRDQPEVFGVGLDGKVYATRFNNVGAFAGGWFTGPPGPVSSLAVAPLANGALDV